LEQFLDEFEVLKLEIRLSKDLHLITVKQQAQQMIKIFFNKYQDGKKIYIISRDTLSCPKDSRTLW